MSDLHELFKKELREIPLRPPEKWVPSATRTRSSGGARWLAPALVVIAVIVASVGAGELLAAVRERLAPASSRAGLPAFREGRDLVYLAEGDASKGYVQVVQMPEATVAARYAGRAVVGSRIDAYAMRAGDDLAFFPVWQEGGRPPGTASTYLQAVVLRSGVPSFRIPTGEVSISSAGPANTVEVAGPHVGEVAVSADNSSVFFVRDIGPSSRATQLTRYDARYDAQTNAPSATAGSVLASRTWTDEGGDAIWSRVVPLDGARVALVRQHVQGTDDLGRATQFGQDWYFLDGELNVLAAYTGQRRLGPTGTCSFDPIPLPNGEWALVCADRGGFAFENLVYFLDGRDFHVLAAVPISRELDFPRGATVAADGTLVVVTGRPVVIRLDINAHRILDRRPVTAASLLDTVGPSIALAKETAGSTIQFTPDGRFAYIAAARGAWWGGLAIIDLERAVLVTHSTSIGYHVVALKLAADGHRLYALTSDENGRADLALVDPATLRVVRRTTVLENAPSVIIAVAGRR